MASPKRKAPPCGRAFLPYASPELAIIGLLLLLTGLLLPAALLLLTWLLTGGLVLLARILVLVAHSGLPLLNKANDNARRRPQLLKRRRFHEGHSVSFVWRAHDVGTGSKNNPVQAFLVRARAVAAPGSRC